MNNPNNRFLLLASLILTLAAASPVARADDAATAPSAATAPVKIDLSTPTKTVLSFAAALDAGSLPDAQNCVANDPAQQKAVEYMIIALTTSKNFEAAAVANFPNDSADLVKAMKASSFTSQLSAGLDENVAADGTTATVSKSAANPSTFKPVALKKVGNDWKIDLSANDDGIKEMARLEATAPKILQIQQVVANELAGQYKTWHEVLAAMAHPQTQPATAQ